MGCGCGGGGNRKVTRRTRTIGPQPQQRQSAVRPQTPQVSGLSGGSSPANIRNEIERKKKIQISLRKRNNPNSQN